MSMLSTLIGMGLLHVVLARDDTIEKPDMEYQLCFDLEAGEDANDKTDDDKYEATKCNVCVWQQGWKDKACEKGIENYMETHHKVHDCIDGLEKYGYDDSKDIYIDTSCRDGMWVDRFYTNWRFSFDPEWTTDPHFYEWEINDEWGFNNDNGWCMSKDVDDDNIFRTRTVGDICYEEVRLPAGGSHSIWGTIPGGWALSHKLPRNMGDSIGSDHMRTTPGECKQFCEERVWCIGFRFGYKQGNSCRFYARNSGFTESDPMDIPSAVYEWYYYPRRFHMGEARRRVEEDDDGKVWVAVPEGPHVKDSVVESEDSVDSKDSVDSELTPPGNPHTLAGLLRSLGRRRMD